VLNAIEIDNFTNKEIVKRIWITLIKNESFYLIIPNHINCEMEIDAIVNIHSYIYKILQYKLSADVINLIIEYCNGFVNIGKLITSNLLQIKQGMFINSFNEFSKLENKHITFQIKYIHNLYFFDFWIVDGFDYSIEYPSMWNISHYNYIYKNGVLLRDKIQFIIEDLHKITDTNSSYPIYDIEKLKKEYFNNFNCSFEWCMKVNSSVKYLLKCKKSYIENKYEYNQVFIHRLFKYFYDLTECRDEMFYENTNQFNLSNEFL
jgi:hypothetical protein